MKMGSANENDRPKCKREWQMKEIKINEKEKW